MSSGGIGGAPQAESAGNMAEEEDRPFKAEYAKSGRAGCKLCKGAISKDSLRVAKMVQVQSTWEGGGREVRRERPVVWSQSDQACVLVTVCLAD